MKGEENIAKIFQQGKAFVAYLTVGDGGIQHTLESALALIEGGVTILELGMPFSDPIADGAVIQRAAARALQNHTTLADVLWLTKKIREVSHIPLILFSYYNPILAVSKTNFFEAASQAGIDGLLLVDCPMEESGLIQQLCEQHALALIYVVTPSTPLVRVSQIAKQGKGFLYYACQKGITGMRQQLPADLKEKILAIQSQVDLPIVVGFGISTRAMVQEVLGIADGVVIGSLFVKALEEGKTPEELRALTREIIPMKML